MSRTNENFKTDKYKTGTQNPVDGHNDRTEGPGKNL